MMETLCNLCDWPVALRGENLATPNAAFSPSERDRYVRRAIAKAAELLRRGEVLAIFPEGYPTIDPVRARKTSDDEILPFARGLGAIVARAERRGAPRIPIIPAGFRYRKRGPRRYDVRLRLGEPMYLGDPASYAALMETLRDRVCELSV